MKNITLWHAPYNGGWVWFDRKQWRSFRVGWRVGQRNQWKGGPDPVLWWCCFGFCGRILLQSWPWQENPGDASWRKAKAAIEESMSREHEAAKLEQQK